MTLSTLALVPVLALVCTPAFAAEPVSAGERLAATCTACHGTRGNTAGTALPPLAGQSKETLLANLKAFKEGSRPATIMTQLAKGYTDEQLAQIAAWFAAQRGEKGEKP
ncbi:cytochrome c [Pseudoduganella lutea]|uniref:Cytochrome c n=2 Tax=Pseudoduganella lutea TaxID=321985 RepID=A0A4P6L797_9BURK|nr:cytochrome c [Pseudoduganella lutea]